MYLLYKGNGTKFVHILRGDSHSFNYEYGVDQGGCLSNIKRCWFVRPILLWVNLFSMNFKLSRGDCIIEVWINLIAGLGSVIIFLRSGELFIKVASLLSGIYSMILCK